MRILLAEIVVNLSFIFIELHHLIIFTNMKRVVCIMKELTAGLYVDISACKSMFKK